MVKSKNIECKINILYFNNSYNDYNEIQRSKQNYNILKVVSTNLKSF